MYKKSTIIMFYAAMQKGNTHNTYIQGGREISVIIVTDDYLCYKEPKSPYNFFFSYFNI